MTDKNTLIAEKRKRRHGRIRAKVFGTSVKPRLVVFRSLRHIHAQIIDDTKGFTLVSAGSTDLKKTRGRKKTDTASLVGEMLAQRAAEKKISQVVFDRAGYKYHGRVKALAEAARGKGLKI